MYKIFINETPLILTNTEWVSKNVVTDAKTLIVNHLGKKKFLHNYIDLLEKSKQYSQVILIFEDVEKLWDDFKSIYKIVEAAGGVVFNTQEEVLMIHRRGFWDLPKGKIDKGETPQEAAIREVQEETGLDVVTFRNEKSCITYHTFIQKEKRILKKTYWYAMNTTETNLIPQTEEDIEKAVFIDLENFLKQKIEIYGSILDVLAFLA